MSARIIKANGVEIPAVPANGTDFQLSELQAIVGGPVEIVPVPNSDSIIVLHEEGKLEELPINQKATFIYANPHDVIVGDVLVCPTEMVQ